MYLIMLFIGFVVGALTTAGVISCCQSKLKAWDIVIGIILATILLLEAAIYQNWGK